MLALRAPRAFDGVEALRGGALVLVEDGGIVGVESARNDPPAGCDLIDLGDVTVLPGLIDMHCHLCCDNGYGAVERLGEMNDVAISAAIADAMACQLAAGVTTVRDVGDRDWAVVEIRDRTRAGLVGQAPTIVAAGPPITSVGGHCGRWGGEVEGGEVALRRAVAERVERGVDVVKIMASGGLNTPSTDATACQYSAQDLRLVVEEAHAAGLPVTAHAHPLEAVERALIAGVDGIEHCSCLTDSGIRMSDSLLQSLVVSRTAVCPTLGLLPGATPSPRIAELMERFGLTRPARLTKLARMYQAGVLVVAGVDSGIAPGKAHGVLPYCISDFVECGIPPAEALAMATSIAARHCGLGDRKGRLLAGFDADLLVVAGDPLSDIGALTSVEAVLVGGSLLDSSLGPTLP
jgi:imidazolonepropionase-like amidohydrolase